MKKLLKGSLVAAFLALGMWASQASAGQCDCACDTGNCPSANSPMCVQAAVCEGGDCGCENWRQECCE
uniref:Uncharacterized protein n=1 Tax=Candidatus Kentrum sp. LPFa TaxID=2126335 RepID=A0A450W220_9GAMM|nr:MAG: hypothetical protein BECKLPF1236B_GA0070989_101932 [Candidatus Kentron sp. LPFa]